MLIPRYGAELLKLYSMDLLERGKYEDAAEIELILKNHGWYITNKLDGGVIECRRNGMRSGRGCKIKG